MLYYADPWIFLQVVTDNDRKTARSFNDQIYQLVLKSIN